MPKPDDRTLVIVDGTPILASDLQIALISGEHSLRYDLWSQPRQLERKLAEMKASMLDTLITQMLLIHEYKRLGGTMKPEYVDEDIERITKSTFKGDRAALRTAVAKEGMSWDDYRLRRERALMEYWMRRRIEDSVPDTFKDEELENYYDKNKKRWRGPVEVKLHTLTLLKTTHLSDAETRRQMEALRARITKGGDFAEIARVESKDSHADDGGAWDWTPLSDLSEDIRSAAAKTQKGRLSAIIEETGHFILLQVDDRRSTPAPPFEKVKTEVAKALREEKGRKSIEHRIYKLRETASIQKPGPV